MSLKQNWFTRQAYFLLQCENVHTLNGCDSVWLNTERCSEFVALAQYSRLSYRVKSASSRVLLCFFRHMLIAHESDLAAPASFMCFPVSFVNSLLGCFKTYCPVCFVTKGALVNRKNRRSRVIRFRNRFFFCCDENCEEQFLSETRRFIAVSLPLELPHRLFAADACRLSIHHVQFLGYCPISVFHSLECVNLWLHEMPWHLWNTMNRGKRLQIGSQSCGAVFSGKVYFCHCEEHLEEFLAYPTKYSSLRLPRRISPPQTPDQLLSHGRLANFLEQTVRDEVSVSSSFQGIVFLDGWFFRSEQHWSTLVPTAWSIPDWQWSNLRLFKSCYG